MASNRWRAITWTYDDLDPWGIHVSLVSMDNCFLRLGVLELHLLRKIISPAGCEKLLGIVQMPE